MTIILPTVATVSNPVGWGYDAHIDELLLRLAVSPEELLQKVTAEAQPPRFDTAESAEDIKDEIGHRYSRTNLSGGAGMSFLHAAGRPDDADVRYWESRGVDVFSEHPGELYSAPLLHATINEEASTAGTLGVAQVDDVVYWNDNTDIYEVGNPVSKRTSTYLQMIAMGNNLYTRETATGVVRIDPTTFTPTTIDSTTTYNEIWGVKSRIVAVDDNILYETHATTPIALLTLPDGDTVTDVIDAGAFILVFATTGIIYTLTLDDSLAIIPVGESPFPSEIPLLGGYTQDVLGIATAQTIEAGGTIMRFYQAVLDDSGIPTDMQLIIQVGDEFTTVDHTPRMVVTSRDSLYVFATSDLNTALLQAWRFYLPTGGWARDLEFAASGNIPSSAVGASNRMWVAIPGIGVFKEDDLYVDSGYFIGPIADFGTADDKQWVSSTLSMKELPAGTMAKMYETLNLDAIDDVDSTHWAFNLDLRSGQSEETNDTSASRTSRYHAVKVLMMSDASHAVTPRFVAYSFRALANPDREQIIRIPVNVSDQYESPRRRAQKVRGRGQAILDALSSYEGKSVVFGVYPIDLEIRGIVEKIDLALEVLPMRGSATVVAFLQIRGKRTTINTGYGATTSGAGFGIDFFGIPMFAIGEVSI